MQYKTIKLIVPVIYLCRLRACYRVCATIYEVTILKQLAKKYRIRLRDREDSYLHDGKIERRMDRQRSICRFNINAVKNVSHFALASGALFSKRHHFAAVNMVPRGSSSSRLPSLTVFLQFLTTRVIYSKSVED